MEVLTLLQKNKVLKNYKFLNMNERKKYLISLKLITEFQIKNLETEFEKNNKKLIELENSRILLIESFLKKKKILKI